MAHTHSDRVSLASLAAAQALAQQLWELTLDAIQSKQTVRQGAMLTASSAVHGSAPCCPLVLLSAARQQKACS